MPRTESPISEIDKEDERASNEVADSLLIPEQTDLSEEPKIEPQTTHIPTLKQEPQLEEPRLVVKMTNHKNMVAPGTRDAPRFQSRRPEELRRFLRQMEDLWRDAEITDPRIKKQSLGKYADYESEEEWSAFRTYNDPHSWEDFKKELYDNYPEAAEAERGTPQRIREVCKDQNELELGDMQGLYAFRRKFMAEAKKLLVPPAVMSNRELVELFIGKMSRQMGHLVLQHLASRAENDLIKQEKKEGVPKEEVPPPKPVIRRPEDRYDLEKVYEAAVAVSENHQGIFRALDKNEKRDASRGREVMAFMQPIPSETQNLAQKLEEIEGNQALEKDKLVNVNKIMEAKLGELESMMKSMLSMTQKPEPPTTYQHPHASSSGNNYERASEKMLGKPGSMPRWGRPVDDKCFYCGVPGHYVPDCCELKTEISLGNLKIAPDGKLRLRDGNRVPMGPMGATIKERVSKVQQSDIKSNYMFESCYENEDGLYIPSLGKLAPSYLLGKETPEQRKARLERELDVSEREEALELRRLKLAREEKRLENSKSTRDGNIQELLGQLTDEEVAALKTAKAGFV